jgi:Uma2 family endonuclease
MTPTKTLITAEEFDNFPFEEDKRYELDEGEFVEMTKPAYKHNRILKRLTVALDSYCEATGVGEVLISENLFALSRDTRRAPDLAVVLGNRQAELENQKVITIIPELMVEVLSPSETTRTIHRKLKQYFAAGVREVWLVDPDSQEIELWTGPTLPDRALTASDSLTSALLPNFALPVSEIFR